MSQERQRVLKMLAEGKITVSEAERLLDALAQAEKAEASGGAQRAGGSASAKAPKYLRIQVDEGPTGDKVHIRVPLKLLRAGIKLKSLLGLLPKEASTALEAKGIDLSAVSEEKIEELMAALSELSIDVDSREGHDQEKVRIFCE